LEVNIMTVRNHLNAMSTLNRINTNNNQLNNTQRNLASGSRINRAGNDPAGLAVAMKMQSRIGGTNMAVRNANDGVSLIQTAEGALSGTHAMLGRLQMLSIQSANGLMSSTQRSFIQNEVDQIMSEISRTANTTEFNGIKLLNGSLAGDNALTLQVGNYNSEGQQVDVSIEAMTPAGLGLSGTNVMTQQSALSSIDSALAAISFVSEQRATLGAVQNRLEHTINSLINTSENLTAANSRIADADMAEEMLNNTTQGILRQAQIALLAHTIDDSQGAWGFLNQGVNNFRA
jgi:flagellin